MVQLRESLTPRALQRYHRGVWMGWLLTGWSSRDCWQLSRTSERGRVFRGKPWRGWVPFYGVCLDFCPAARPP